MRRGTLSGFWAIIVGMCAAVPAWGASFWIDALPTAAFDPFTFQPIPLTLDSSGNLLGGQPMVVQVDISLLSSGYSAADGELGFGNIAFNIDLFGGFHNTTMPGWSADNPLVSPMGPNSLCQAPRWIVNGDVGAANDLKSILISNPRIQSPHPLDPRPLQTVDQALKVGSVFIDWSGIGEGGLRISAAGASFAKIGSGELQMYEPGQSTMIGGIFGTPGWEPPALSSKPPSNPPKTPAPDAPPQTPSVDPIVIPPSPPQTEPIVGPPILTPDTVPPDGATPPLGVGPVMLPSDDSPGDSGEAGSPTVPALEQPAVIALPLDSPIDIPIQIMPWPSYGGVHPLPWLPIDGEIATIDGIIPIDFVFAGDQYAAFPALLHRHLATNAFDAAALRATATEGVPEPSSFLLAAIAAAGFAVAARRRSRATTPGPSRA